MSAATLYFTPALLSWDTDLVEDFLVEKFFFSACMCVLV